MKLSISVFVIFSLTLPLTSVSQEALRYFPLEQGNAWVFYHEHIVQEGVVVKPASTKNTVVKSNTLTMKVNGTITELGNTYAILELDNKVWGYCRVEGNYLYKKYNGFEGKLVDFTPSDEDSYVMIDTVFLNSTSRNVETRTLPCGIMSGYGCDIERSIDALHEGKYMFFVDSIGPAFFSSYDFWKVPPESDVYYLMSYNVKLNPSSIQEVKVQKSFELHPAIPNPFNPSTTISFTLNNPVQVNLAVYNLNGQKVTTLVNGFLNVGRHEIMFDGSGLASGVYLYCFESGSFRKSGKMLLMK